MCIFYTIFSTPTFFLNALLAKRNQIIQHPASGNLIEERLVCTFLRNSGKKAVDFLQDERFINCIISFFDASFIIFEVFRFNIGRCWVSNEKN